MEMSPFGVTAAASPFMFVAAPTATTPIGTIGWQIWWQLQHRKKRHAAPAKGSIVRILPFCSVRREGLMIFLVLGLF
jgi:hypothetical protein